MSLRVVFGPEASTEVEEAAVWYEAQRSGLGLAFLGAVDAVVEQIAGWPDAGSLVAGIDEQLAVRRAPVPRFPYYLAYVLAADDALRVLAVAHDRRLPGYWHSRAGDASFVLDRSPLELGTDLGSALAEDRDERS